MIKEKKIYINIRTGELSKYGLACGYTMKARAKTCLEHLLSKSLIYVKLWQENNTYRLVATNRYDYSKVVEECFDYNELTKAKKLYKQLIKI